MFRSLIIIAALVLVYLLLKNRLQKRNISKPEASSSHSQATVQCLECRTYVPRNEAINSGKEYFCCKQHQRDWQTRQG